MTAMECKEIFARLSEYLDGELPADLCEEIAAHIEDCQPCVDFVNTLRHTVDLCRGMKSAPDGPRPLPPELKQQLLELLQRKPA